MNKFPLLVSIAAAFVSVAHGGPEISASKETVAACPDWYADTEWNVGVWGAYAFTSEQYRDDRYIESDHAWGGGLDAKYFFRRYFGIGIEGYVLDSTRTRGSLVRLGDIGGNSRAIGSVAGTFTLRYPFRCSRFSPYAFAGGGVIFGGGERDSFVVVRKGIDFFGDRFSILDASHEGSRTEAFGQFGAGLEVRLTPHIGLTSDFSWNVIDGPSNNFGMVRSGINFGF
jgi:hypothetical protein